MGGMGSGEYTREYRCKARVEECCSIDSFALLRRAKGRSSTGILRWQWSGDDILSVYTKRVTAGWLVWASVVNRQIPDADLWATMEVVGSQFLESIGSDNAGLDPEVNAAHEMWSNGKAYAFPFATVYSPQIIGLETTTSGAGATCEWFNCPVYQNGDSCGRRSRKLYWRDGLFACRQCHDLAYISQRQVRADRLMRNAEKVRQKVLLSLPDEEAAQWRDTPIYFPPHPPDMTLRRYEKLFDQWSSSRMTANKLIMGKMLLHADRMLHELGLETADMDGRTPPPPRT